MEVTYPFRGLFIDLDGTLADSEPTLYGCYRRFMRSLGYEADPREFELIVGPPLPEMVAVLQARRHLPGTVVELEARYREIIAERYLDEVAPSPGARALLSAALGMGKMVWVVTSAPMAIALPFLRRHGLTAFVAGVVSGDEVERGKPDPEIYIRALRLSHMDAPDVIALEDSAAGLRAALSAGVRTMLVGRRADAGVSARSRRYLGRAPDLVSARDRLVGSPP